MHDVTIADKLRAAGLRVVEFAGWQSRGSAVFNPRGFVWHHTAGPRTGKAPSLTVCVYGRRGLPGPLCNVFLARDGVCYVVAAGRANHAGTGGWQGLTGNSSVYGLEVENTGTGDEPWTPELLDIAARVAAALDVPPRLACMHKEWTRRKIDMHTVPGSDLRARMTVPAPPSAPTPKPLKEEEYEMEAPTLVQVTPSEDGKRGHRLYRLTADTYATPLSGAEWERLKSLHELARQPFRATVYTDAQWQAVGIGRVDPTTNRKVV